MKGVMDVTYTAPDGTFYMVDRSLDNGILDRLNKLARGRLACVCGGHIGPDGGPAYFSLRGRQAELELYHKAIEGNECEVVYEDPRSAGVLMTTFYTGRDGVPTLAWWMSMLDRLERS